MQKFKKDFLCECKLRSVPGAQACAWVLDTRAKRLVGVRGSVNCGTGGWLTSMERTKSVVRKLFQSQNIAGDRPHGWWECEQSAVGIGPCERETSASG